MLEYNDLMSAQSTRWVYSRIMEAAQLEVEKLA
jgi:hypothetical protein